MEIDSQASGIGGDGDEEGEQQQQGSVGVSSSVTRRSQCMLPVLYMQQGLWQPYIYMREGETEAGETLMGEVVAPPSSSSDHAASRNISFPAARLAPDGIPYPQQPYNHVGVVPFSGMALPQNEAYPYGRAPYSSSPANYQSNPFLAGSNGPPAPFDKLGQEHSGSRRSKQVAKSLLLGGKIHVFLALLVMAMLMPVLVKLHLGFVHRAEVRRVYRVRTFQHRTAFHFQPAMNWMNDPNGLMYHHGYYHLFYQYNPEAPVWGNIIWGHAVSTDLIHWQHLEPALKGDQWYDIKGVWSGSATILPDGTPVLMYTGWSETFAQTQNMAFPANKDDPLLRRWVKASQNPVAVVPLGYNASQFRDPSTAWQGPDHRWRFIVGAQKETGAVGTALLYKSADFQTWNFSHSLHSVPATGMWECPDFYPVLGLTMKHVLKISTNDELHDYYTVGTYITENDTFLPANVNLDAGIGLRYDYGKFYASKSFYDQSKSRRILFGWVNESDSEEADVRKGWASVMSIPRQVWLDNRTTTSLMQYPVEELNLLHDSETSEANVTVGAGSFIELDGVSGNQLDIEVSFAMPKTSQGFFQPPELLAFESGQQACARSKAYFLKNTTVIGPFGVYVLATEDFQERTAIYFRVLQSPGELEGLKILVCSDQSRSSVAKNLDTQDFGSFVRVYETDEFLSLRILVDHSIVETFVQGGRTVITSRVYPELALDDDAHIFLFNNGTTPITASSIRVWNMNNAEITQVS